MKNRHPLPPLGLLLILLPLALALFAPALAFEDANATFVKATEAYKANDFETARAAYESILTDGQQHAPELFYNLGNTHFQLGDPGRAILNYRRAERFIPRNPELIHNLAYVREQTGAAPPATALPLRWLRSLSHTTWMGLAVAAFWLTALLLCLLLWRNASRATLIKTALLGGALFLLGMTGGHFTAPMNQLDELVILNPDQSARYTPLPNAKDHFKVPAGTIAFAKDRQSGMTEINWNGKTGWIPESAAAFVDVWSPRQPGQTQYRDLSGPAKREP